MWRDLVYRIFVAALKVAKYVRSQQWFSISEFQNTVTISAHIEMWIILVSHQNLSPVGISTILNPAVPKMLCGSWHHSDIASYCRVCLPSPVFDILAIGRRKALVYQGFIKSQIEKTGG